MKRLSDVWAWILRKFGKYGIDSSGAAAGDVAVYDVDNEAVVPSGKQIGNVAGNVPVSNGAECAGLVAAEATNATDSDKLDGQHGSYYRNASNLNAGTIPADRLNASDLLTKIKTVDGSGSGLDADLLDGAHLSALMQANDYNIAFRAYLSSTLNLTDTSKTYQVVFQTESFDTHSYYDNSTGKFTAGKAGYYMIHVCLRFNGISAAENGCILYFYKNVEPSGGYLSGSGDVEVFSYQVVADGVVQIQCSEIVYLNGSSDFIIIGARSLNDSSASLEALSRRTYIMGYRVA